MAENSKIEWTHHTFNPWLGCTKVSPACDHCYAEVSTASRALNVNWGAGQLRKRTSKENWKLPIKWNKNAEKNGTRYRVFCASLADIFDNEVDQEWRKDLFHLIHATPNLDWLLLTKRIGNVPIMMGEVNGDFSNTSLPKNVWLGITICNQEEADRDIPKLLKVNPKIRFLSIEPILDSIDLCETFSMWWNQTMNCYEGTRSCGFNKHPRNDLDSAIDWVIVGGESGRNARPMQTEWAKKLLDQCNAARVPFFFKQLSRNQCPEFKDYSSFPDELKVRNFPKS